MHIYMRNLLDIVANLQDCDIVVNEFELSSRYYVHFQTNELENSMNSLIPLLISLSSFYKHCLGIK